MMMKKVEFYYQELYGNGNETALKFQELMQIVAQGKQNRSEELKKQDEKGKNGYLSQKMVGMMLYIDKFSDNFLKFEKKIDYLVELGITYVHLMPFLQSREGNNDGGYAVSDYLKVDNRFGNTQQFERVVKKLREKGIKTCCDFVLNHTAKEHEWAEKCRKGNPEYKDMYFMFDGDDVTKKYEETLTEIFPGVAPKNFTYYPEINKYVMTRFYEFQWDLNFGNPHVFNKIIEVLLSLANKGIEIFRLDAIPFMWKQLDTSCINLPQVHIILKMMEMIVEEVCPSVIFLGEAIVEPHEIVKYFGSDEEKECHVMYNASLMVLLWNSLATRDTRLMTRSMEKDYGTPDDGVWINYARCHDDIGWGFEQDILRSLGFDEEAHKQFIISFFEGKFPGSFSRGELYEFNPLTLDARNSGTLASLCGLEEALNEKHTYKEELAIKRILLLNGIIISYTGIPLLYSGDEIGQLNYWEYKNNLDEAHDSRWLHRGPMDWKKAAKRNNLATVEGKIFNGIKKMIEIRKKSELFVSTLKSFPINTWNAGVLGFHKENKMLVLANFTEECQWVETASVNGYDLPKEMTDLLTGRKVILIGKIMMGPYEFVWLQ